MRIYNEWAITTVFVIYIYIFISTSPLQPLLLLPLSFRFWSKKQRLRQLSAKTRRLHSYHTSARRGMWDWSFGSIGIAYNKRKKGDYKALKKGWGKTDRISFAKSNRIRLVQIRGVEYYASIRLIRDFNQLILMRARELSHCGHYALLLIYIHIYVMRNGYGM